MQAPASEIPANVQSVNEDDLPLEESPVPKDDSPLEDGFAHDEERFFSAAETTEPSPMERAGEEHPGSIAPTVLDAASPASQGLELASAAPEHSLEMRRKRLRKAVMFTLCASAALLLIGVARRPVRNIHAKSSSPSGHIGIVPAQAPVKGTQLLAPSPAVLPIASETATSSAPLPRDERAARKSANELVVTARSLLQAGRTRAGVDAARLALAANGSDAEPYILLAAGLQDLGDWSGAQRVFAACKANARSGAHAECSYFSGQKH